MKTFDYDKARKICEREDVVEAEGGLREDWNWTAGTIYENGEFNENGVGYDNSIWATPVIKYTTKDGKQQLEDCYIDDKVEASEKAKLRCKTFAQMTGAHNVVSENLIGELYNQIFSDEETEGD